MKKVLSTFNSLNTSTKVIVVVVLAALIFLIYRRFFKKSEEKAVENALNEIPLVKSNVTLSDSDLTIMANQIYTAVKGAGTDTKAVEAAFARIKTKDDLVALIRKFGVRDGLTLSQWIRDDFSGKALTAYQSIFEGYGLSF